jgi:hypothetical protein
MTLIVRPGFQFDDDASTYIEAVEAADTQALETNTRYAINDFVIGCKQDGIWSAIKASCILAGARTLSGCLVPLVGTAPTNVGPFVSGDYNRKTGLVGDGSTKYLDTNFSTNVLTTTNAHLCVNVSTLGSFGEGLIGNFAGSAGIQDFAGTYFYRFISNTSGDGPSRFPRIAGFTGYQGSTLNRIFRNGGVNTVLGATGTVSLSALNTRIFFMETGRNNFTDARISFYSIGESLDLALLDARVSALITAFGVAIP